MALWITECWVFGSEVWLSSLPGEYKESVRVGGRCTGLEEREV